MLRTVIAAIGLAAAVTSEASAAERPVTLAVLKTDVAKYRGKTLEVSGRLSVLGEVATLGIDAADARTVLVELENLPRDQRQVLVAKCSEGCNLHIRGKGGPVLRELGVIATDLPMAEVVPAKVASSAN